MLQAQQSSIARKSQGGVCLELVIERVLVKNDKDYDIEVRDFEGQRHLLFPGQAVVIEQLARRTK